MIDLKIESRHSDYGADAGGYRILRYKGEWLGRIEDYKLAEELVAEIKALEKINENLVNTHNTLVIENAKLRRENQFQKEVLQTLEVTDLDFENRTFKVLADKTKWHGVFGTNG